LYLPLNLRYMGGAVAGVRTSNTIVSDENGYISCPLGATTPPLRPKETTPLIVIALSGETSLPVLYSNEVDVPGCVLFTSLMFQVPNFLMSALLGSGPVVSCAN